MVEINQPTKKRCFITIDGLLLFASLNIVLFHIENLGGFYNMSGAPGRFFKIVK